MKIYLSRITDATVDTFATCDFNFRMRKYIQCGPRLRDSTLGLVGDWVLFTYRRNINVKEHNQLAILYVGITSITKQSFN